MPTRSSARTFFLRRARRLVTISRRIVGSRRLVTAVLAATFVGMAPGCDSTPSGPSFTGISVLLDVDAEARTVLPTGAMLRVRGDVATDIPIDAADGEDILVELAPGTYLVAVEVFGEVDGEDVVIEYFETDAVAVVEGETTGVDAALVSFRPELIAPPDEIARITSFILEWTPLPGAESYVVQVSVAEAGFPGDELESTGASISLGFNPVGDRTLYVRVRGVSRFGTSGWPSEPAGIFVFTPVPQAS